MSVPERLLQYIWLHRLFMPNGMTTTDGEPIEVVNVGQINSDGGPDFFNAQIRIGATLWAGNVEIHCTSDDWFLHGHDRDAAYDNVVLHVVGQRGSRQAMTSKGSCVPECELRFPPSIVERYNELSESHTSILCADKLGSIPRIKRSMWMERLFFERMEQLEGRVTHYLEEFAGDWDQTFFVLLARAMGGNVNSQPMEMLARQTPLKIIMKHPELSQVEALLFGQSGLLLEASGDDSYIAMLRREYDFLQAKFSLTPMDASLWKHLRLRPANFPEIRLAQLAAILSAIPGNFENAFKTLDVKVVSRCLDVCASAYWNNHYSFGKESTRDYKKRLGKAQQQLIMVNAVVPFIFTSVHRMKDEEGMNNVLKFLQFLPAESNRKLSDWHDAGIKVDNEADAQALLLLSKEYCLKRKCFACVFGHEILSRKE